MYFKLHVAHPRFHFLYSLDVAQIAPSLPRNRNTTEQTKRPSCSADTPTAGHRSTAGRGPHPPPTWLDFWAPPATLYWAGHAAFFAFGNSNSIATISTANAFIGLDPRSKALPALLVLCNVYAGPFGFRLVGALFAARGSGCGWHGWHGWHGWWKRRVGAGLLVAQVASSAGLALCAAYLVVHRGHLFVWSVFAPKFAYACVAAIAEALVGAVVAALASVW